jgi:LysR family pca operon transcriptional activator
MELSAFNHRIRLRHIHCLVAVAREGNLGRAAEQLRLSQPAVSKTLAELEAITGARLFERGRLGARLTRHGEAFLSHAITALEALENARRAVGNADIAGPETLYIGALPTLAADLLPEVLESFRRERPQVRTVIESAANAPLLDMLKAGSLDFVLGRMAEPDMMLGIAFELLYTEALALVVAAQHPLAAQRHLSMAEVLKQPLVVATRGTVPRHNTESLLQAHGLKLPRNCIETLSLPLARQIVLRSGAVWITPRSAVRHDLQAGLLAALPLATAGSEEAVGLLQRSDSNLGPAARDCMRMLRAAAGRLAQASR